MTFELSDQSSAGDPLDSEFEVVYDQLRQLAAWFLAGERQEHTLQPTALLHEAYLKLAAGSNITFRSREHFLALAAQAMRRILVDHARKRAAAKRNGGMRPIEFGHLLVVHSEEEMIDVDRALKQLARLDPRSSRILELSLFGGMNSTQIAEMFELSPRMVRHEIAHARAWLLECLGESEGSRQQSH